MKLQPIALNALLIVAAALPLMPRATAKEISTVQPGYPAGVESLEWERETPISRASTTAIELLERGLGEMEREEYVDAKRSPTIKTV